VRRLAHAEQNDGKARARELGRQAGVRGGACQAERPEKWDARKSKRSSFRQLFPQVSVYVAYPSSAASRAKITQDDDNNLNQTKALITTIWNVFPNFLAIIN
jgi:hypothetical protein